MNYNQMNPFRDEYLSLTMSHAGGSITRFDCRFGGAIIQIKRETNGAAANEAVLLMHWNVQCECQQYNFNDV